MPVKKKQNKTGRGTFAANVLAVFSNDPFKSFNYKQVAAAMGIRDKASRDMVYAVMKDLAREGLILEVKAGKYKLDPRQIRAMAPSSRTITGIVDMKQTGKAYISSQDLGEDVYISAANTGRALHGDTVKVFLFPRRPGRKLEGQVAEVIKRARTQFVGTLQVSARYAFFVPDNTSFSADFFIPKESLMDAHNGDKVVVKMTDWPEHARNPFGEVIKILGKPGEHKVEMQSILVEFDFPLSFSKQAENESAAIPDTIPDEEIRLRRDFRNIFTITIDPPDAKDFDDALSLLKLDNGHWEVGVHIADVSHYVRPGTATDDEGALRGTSVYLVDRVIPMLPERISNFICSLRPEEDKLCFSTVFEMDEKGLIHNEWFGKTIIRSDKRFNYDEVQEVIEGADHPMKPQILTLHNLASRLREERYKKGAINFETQEVKFHLDETGKPIGVYIKEQKEAHRLIEDFMLLANRRVAEWIGKTKQKEKARTFVYRIHDEPSPEKINQFSQFVSKLGYSLKLGSRKVLAHSMNRLFKDVAGKGEENMIESIAIRTMAKAQYSTDNIGHYGLAFDYYTHFTSPIRRYPDLMVHRLLWDYMNGAKSADKEYYEGLCKHASEMERKAMEAERASTKLKQAEYLSDKVGQIFEALISGVSKYGIYAEIVGNKCEGMVKLRDLHDDFYYLDEENYQVIGQRYGETYKLGDPVRIMVKNVDVNRKQIDFALVK